MASLPADLQALGQRLGDIEMDDSAQRALEGLALVEEFDARITDIDEDVREGLQELETTLQDLTTRVRCPVSSDSLLAAFCLLPSALC